MGTLTDWDAVRRTLHAQVDKAVEIAKDRETTTEQLMEQLLVMVEFAVKMSADPGGEAGVRWAITDAMLQWSRRHGTGLESTRWYLGALPTVEEMFVETERLVEEARSTLRSDWLPVGSALSREQATARRTGGENLRYCALALSSRHYPLTDTAKAFRELDESEPGY